jgi:hypothetical protein
MMRRDERQKMQVLTDTVLWVTLLKRSQDADIPASCSSDVVANNATSLDDLLHPKGWWWPAT